MSYSDRDIVEADEDGITRIRVPYTPRGAAREVFFAQDKEVLMSGPAGTGKSRAALEKCHLVLSSFKNARGLMLRKTLNSLTSSGIVTYTKHVLHPLDEVRFFSGNKQKPASFIYPNGAEFVVGGLDNPTKVMSTEYDFIFIQEAIEVSENDWESCLTRLRNRVVPFQQLIADTNPDAPHHWLKQRVDAGKIRMLDCQLEDNPILFNEDGTVTKFGKGYIETLDSLTGVRFQRLRHGRWVSAEGIVYENYERAKHLLASVPRFHRYVAAVDWGFTNAGVITIWGVDNDGRMYLVEEVYQTRKLIDWWLKEAMRLQQLYRPEAWVCDPAEPGFIVSFQGANLYAIPAYNEIRPGILAVQERLQTQPDGRTRLYFAKDALSERDEELAAKAKPFCIDQEMDSYVWAKEVDGKPNKEKPLDEHNHGLDTLRYAVGYVDRLGELKVAGDRVAVGGHRQILDQFRNS